MEHTLIFYCNISHRLKHLLSTHTFLYFAFSQRAQAFEWHAHFICSFKRSPISFEDIHKWTHSHRQINTHFTFTEDIGIICCLILVQICTQTHTILLLKKIQASFVASYICKCIHSAHTFTEGISIIQMHTANSEFFLCFLDSGHKHH